jgi:GxxExxY protein
MKQGAGEPGRFWEHSQRIIGACIEVHRHLGPGLLESAYEECLAYELRSLNLRYERQVPLRVSYKGISLARGYRIDLVVEGTVIVEVKATEELSPVHHAQVITYLKLTQLPVALLVNFGAPSIKDGLRRFSLRTRSSPAPRLPANPLENSDER